MKKLLIAMFAVMTAAVWAVPASEARIDFYNYAAGGAVKIANKGNAHWADAQKWMQSAKRGGALAQFYLKKNDWKTLVITMQTVKDGNLEIQVKGPDVRKEGKFVPANVDVSKIVVNGKVLYEGKDGQFLTVWHNSAKYYTLPAKADETFKVEVTARPSAK